MVKPRVGIQGSVHARTHRNRHTNESPVQTQCIAGCTQMMHTCTKHGNIPDAFNIFAPYDNIVIMHHSDLDDASLLTRSASVICDFSCFLLISFQTYKMSGMSCHKHKLDSLITQVEYKSTPGNCTTESHLECRCVGVPHYTTPRRVSSAH